MQIRKQFRETCKIQNSQYKALKAQILATTAKDEQKAVIKKLKDEQRRKLALLGDQYEQSIAEMLQKQSVSSFLYQSFSSFHFRHLWTHQKALFGKPAFHRLNNYVVKNEEYFLSEVDEFSLSQKRHSLPQVTLVAVYWQFPELRRVHVVSEIYINLNSSIF